jgi:uncharacterized protein YkwD
MRTQILAAGLLAAALVLPAAQATAHQAPTSARADRVDRATKVKPRSDAWETQVLKLTNAHRKAHGVKPLKAGNCPDHFAETWTRHMARTQVLEHQSLAPFFQRCAGISTAGENIAFGYETPRALVSAWMHSKGHRENILNPHFHRIGVSGWRATNGITYATQDFVG